MRSDCFIINAGVQQKQTNKMTPSEISDQPGIRPIWSESSCGAICEARKPKILCEQERIYSWRMWHFVGFVLLLLIFLFPYTMKNFAAEFCIIYGNLIQINATEMFLCK